MRENGESLGDISKNLHIAKSTLSFWCKDIILSESSIRKIKTKGKDKSVRGLLRFYLKWLKLRNVEKESLIFRLTLNEFFRKEEYNIKNFWINF